MSRPSTSELQLQIAELRAALAALTLRVQELEGAESESVGSFELAGGSGGPSTALASSQAIDPADHGARAELAKQIGAFIKRALRDDHRGSSGRDRLRLSSRYYLVFASFDGERFNPPRLCDTFGEVRALCKRASNCGVSIFVGLPTLWESRAVVLEAGCQLPDRLTA